MLTSFPRQCARVGGAEEEEENKKGQDKSRPTSSPQQPLSCFQLGDVTPYSFGIGPGGDSKNFPRFSRTKSASWSAVAGAVVNQGAFAIDFNW